MKLLSNTIKDPLYGGKINKLIDLISLGYNVPDGLIITEQDYMNKNLLEEQVKNFFNNKNYIVRSSSSVEDGVSFSFAGQYESIKDCRSVDKILKAIDKCFDSSKKHKVDEYKSNNRIEEKTKFNVLIQEYITPDISGVVFATNPTSSNDKKGLIEFIYDEGEKIVSGKTDAVSICFDWYDVLEDKKFDIIKNDVINLSRQYKQPMEMEFCIKNEKLYYVQMRPITRFSNIVDNSKWTITNFQDGGVSAQSCPNLMWSLYNYAWTTSQKSFIRANNLISKNRKIDDLLMYKYARVYWDIGIAKESMVKVPGFVEREFDDELGVIHNYQGDGEKYKFNLLSTFNLINTALKINKSTKLWRKNVSHITNKLITRYNELDNLYSNISTREEIEYLYKELLNKDYLNVEGSYFTQAFINTIQLSLKKKIILRYMNNEEFLNAIYLDNTSHTRLDKKIDELVKVIRDNNLEEKWNKKSLGVNSNIKLTEIEKGLIEEILNEFGYHSYRELNLLYPSYNEDPTMLYHLIAQKLINNKSRVRPKVNIKKKAVKKQINDLKDLLWWREELKDISTRYYYLIRIYTLKLANIYVDEGYIENVDDLFYVDYKSLCEFIDGHITDTHLREIIEQNKEYVDIYENANIPTDLFEYDNVSDLNYDLKGLCASCGMVEGRVRVILDLEDLYSIKPGEILVTRFTDTGWSPIFNQISGLITQTGGVLCHASIVAREYNIPTLVGVKQATDILKTGMEIKLDATNEIIEILED